jgi:sulfoacetaldehyde dehydrogenase
MTGPDRRDEAIVAEKIARARAAMAKVEGFDEPRLNRLCRAIGWRCGNEKDFTRLARMGVDESGIGDRDGRPAKRFKIHGVLRDALRGKSAGIVEELPEKGIVKYAKPAGVIASVVPMTNPALTPPATGIYAAKARDAVIFSPHPRTCRTTVEMVELMRAACEAADAPPDLFQAVERPSIPLARLLMRECDLTLATGGKAMVQSAYSSGRPAYGVGAGNSTVVIDETADVADAARNTRISKTSDFGSGCSADGNIVIQQSVYRRMLAALQSEGGHLCDARQKALLEAALWDQQGNRRLETVACPPQKIAAAAGFAIAAGCRFLMAENHGLIGAAHNFSREKLTTVMALYRYDSFADAIDIVRRLFAVGGRGHSCGIYSHDDARIDALARAAPVSRIMVRQPQSKANAGAFTNGMPMTSSLGCGVWGGNITNENIALKHFMNYTWVSRPIPEDKPSEAELFGEFYGT